MREWHHAWLGRALIVAGLLGMALTGIVLGTARDVMVDDPARDTATAVALLVSLAAVLAGGRLSRRR